MSAEIRHITLSHLNGIIQDTLSNTFQGKYYWIVADVTEHSYKEATGFHYFEFVEKNPQSNVIVAKIKGAAWGDASRKIKNFENITGQRFSNNIHILAKVSISFHKVFGLTLNLEEIDPNFTLGVIEAKRQETLLRLLTNFPDVIQKRGNQYFTKNKSLPLPPVISKIAVISSKTSAGNEDFKHTLINNSYGFHFEIDDYFTVVQNEANAGKLVEAIISIYNSGIKYDAVIINRGGGSQTDFLIFDNYKIGLAIAKFPFPIITGIGHQKNETIADMMAHTATKTPTKAAEFIITHNKQFEDAVNSFQNKIIIASQTLLSGHKENYQTLRYNLTANTTKLLSIKERRLNNLGNNLLSFTQKILHKYNLDLINSKTILQTFPIRCVPNALRDISAIKTQLLNASKSTILDKRKDVKNAISIIKIISPDNILKKGFAIVKHNGEVISDATVLKPKNEIEIILKNTSLNSVIKSKKQYDGTDFNLPESI